MARSAVGDLFRTERDKRGWTPQECARAAGYKNVDRGANRLLAIERGRDRFQTDDVLNRFAEALGLSQAVIASLREEEPEIALPEGWTPLVFVKPFAGFYARLETPPALDSEGLLAFGIETARRLGVQTCVVHSPSHCTYIKPDGTTFESSHAPYMRLG